MVPKRDHRKLSTLLMLFAEKCQTAIGATSAVTALERLLAAHSRDPEPAKQTMRLWLESDPGVFWPSAFHLLRRKDGKRSCTIIRRAIESLDDLVEPLLDVNSFRGADVAELARAFRDIRSMLDVIVTRHVNETAERAGPAFLNRVLRALDIVEIVTETERLPKVLASFRHIDDERVQSKISLLLARCTRTPTWLEERIRDADPRLRANTIQGLWSAKATPEILGLLWEAVEDNHHRVVGNALVALILFGDEEALIRLHQLVAHEEADFRAAAAWAMGELRDPCYLDSLQRMAKQEKGIVRQNALKALVRIRKASGGPRAA